MKAHCRYPLRRFFGILVAVALALFALFALMSLLPATQPRPALAQGSGERTVTHTIVSHFNVCTVLPSTNNRVFTDTVLSSADGGEIRLAAFLEDYFQKSLRHVRVALLLAIFFYGIFGILDAWIAPDVKLKLWFIRYGIFVPFVFAVFLFSFSEHFKKFMQVCLTSVILVAGFGIIEMILIAPYPGNFSYYAGLILVFIFGYAFSLG